jgi:chemotaxis methyl-accepting protein methylase
VSAASADRSPRPGGGAPGGGPVGAAARLLAERTGMQVTQGLSERLAACLDRAARAAGRSPVAHAASLAADPGAFDRLLDCVTVQESGFFRHPDQFAALADAVLPSLEGPVVVWSAGCANGQEAYSLAMELAASGRPDWRVLATDISAAAVARTRAGRYTTAEVAGVPPVHRRWLHPAGDLWEVDPGLRQRVRAERASLTGGFPAEPGRCQVVFCRNVLIYLSRAVAESFLTRLAAWLAPGGLVFLGYSETVLPPTPGLRAEVVGGAHVLRVAETGGREPGGLRTTADAQVRAGLPSRSGGPGSGRSGSRPPGDAGHPSGDAGHASGPATAADIATAADMAAAGDLAVARGDPAAAVAAFRKAVFLDPDRPVAWFRLGLALGTLQDGRGAHRAYAAALAALERCDQGTLEADLDGWGAGDLKDVLRAKLAGHPHEGGP